MSKMMVAHPRQAIGRLPEFDIQRYIIYRFLSEKEGFPFPFSKPLFHHLTNIGKAARISVLQTNQRGDVMARKERGHDKPGFSSFKHFRASEDRRKEKERKKKEIAEGKRLAKKHVLAHSVN